MLCSEVGGHILGQFALVSYLPDPLASFLDNLRLELTPHCKPRAHVTVLPPRPFTGDLTAAVEKLREMGQSFPSFEVELGEIKIFPDTNVIYLSLKGGESSLHALQQNLNVAPLKFDGRFDYHPHITIAQDFDPALLNDLEDTAKEAWAQFTGPRRFLVDVLTFVQNVATMTWVDVAKIPLAQPIPVESAA